MITTTVFSSQDHHLSVFQSGSPPQCVPIMITTSVCVPVMITTSVCVLIIITTSVCFSHDHPLSVFQFQSWSPPQYVTITDHHLSVLFITDHHFCILLITDRHLSVLLTTDRHLSVLLIIDSQLSLLLITDRHLSVFLITSVAVCSLAWKRWTAQDSHAAVYWGLFV